MTATIKCDICEKPILQTSIITPLKHFMHCYLELEWYREESFTERLDFCDDCIRKCHDAIHNAIERLIFEEKRNKNK